MEITNPTLSYDKHSSSTDLTVGCNVRWTEDELELRGRYWVRVALIGWDVFRDDNLGTYDVGTIECDGHTNPQPVENTFRVSNSRLNEDPGRDEIQAKIYVTAGAAGSPRTNRITGRF